MTDPWIWVAAIVVGYGIGTINPASLIARARGIDLTEVGSGNPGATNAARAMGRKTGILVGLLDVLKGLIPAVIFSFHSVGAAELAGFAAVVGHVTSPFLRGRGGKGVATTLGALLGAQPLWVPFVLLAFGIGSLTTRRIGMGAVLGAIALIVAALLTPGIDSTLFGIGLAFLVILRHRSNIVASWSDWRNRGRPSAPGNLGQDPVDGADQSGS